MTSSERQVKTLGTQEHGGRTGVDAEMSHFSWPLQGMGV